MVSEEHRLTSLNSLTVAWISVGGPMAIGGASGRPGMAEISASLPEVFAVLKILAGLDDLQRLFLSICARLPSDKLQQLVRPSASASPNAVIMAAGLHECDGDIDIADEKRATPMAIPWYELFIHLDADLD